MREHRQQAPTAEQPCMPAKTLPLSRERAEAYQLIKGIAVDRHTLRRLWPTTRQGRQFHPVADQVPALPGNESDSHELPKSRAPPSASIR